MCLTADTCLTADPGVASSIPARFHTFAEIDHKIISTAILISSTDSRRVVVSYIVQAKVCARRTVYLLSQACPGKRLGKVK